MVNTYYDSQLTAAEIEAALEAIDGVISPSNNGKVLAIESGKIVARSVTWPGGGGGNMQTKTVTPTAAGLVVEPDSGYDGLSSVVINGDADLVAGNIKKNVEIFGVTGSYDVGRDGYFSRYTPVYEDYSTGAYIGSGVWYVSGGSGTFMDIYQVEMNKKYLCMLDSNTGNRFRAAFFTSDPTQFTETFSGMLIGLDVNNPRSHEVKGDVSSSSLFPFIPSQNGYIVIGKCNDNTSGIKTYLFEVLF